MVEDRKRRLELAGMLKDEVAHLRRFAQSLAGPGNPHLAEDLQQDCLERALRHAHQFRPGTNLRAWLFSILKNTYIDHLRRKRRAGPTLPLDDVILRQPASQADHVALHRTLTAVDNLRPDEQRVLRLVVVDGMKYGQVARRLGIAEGTVKSRLSRARERLRAA